MHHMQNKSRGLVECAYVVLVIINKGTKNVRNPHILRILPILNLFEVFKIFWDFIWVGRCLNRFITLGRW